MTFLPAGGTRFPQSQGEPEFLPRLSGNVVGGAGGGGTGPSFPGTPCGWRLPHSMAALFGLELLGLHLQGGVEVPGLHLQGPAAEKLEAFLC